jgi:hypothetical protein
MLYIYAMRFHRGARMCNLSRVLQATFIFLALASFDVFPITVDLTSPAIGSLSGDQRFNDSRAIEIGVVCPVALSVTGMTLREFSVREDGTGSLGGRIYDSQSGILIAASESTVATGFHQSITIPIFAELQPGHTYRVGFYAGRGEFIGASNGIVVDRPGGLMTPYFERSGLLQIQGIFQSNNDAFPTTPYPVLPFISIEVTQAPDPL